MVNFIIHGVLINVMLKKNEQGVLLRLARKTIQDYFKVKKTRIPEKTFLKQKRGVFVTLETLTGGLRGCIGYPLPNQELGLAVRDNAINAAFHDPRFNPLTEKELDNIIIEISVLTLPQKSSYEKIVPGDGVIIECEGRSALFLPQVWEQISDKKTFFEQLCLKAWLPKNAYLEHKTTIKKFSVQAFKEERLT
jgi:AmmeMemoRadiSam system protein A